MRIDRKSRARFPGWKIVERARSQIGSREYNLVFFNCEHFARWCRTGVYESDQVNSAIDIAVESVAYVAQLINGDNSHESGKKLLSKLTDYLS